MNYLSTLSIFMKQTTYLATLPNKARKALVLTQILQPDLSQSIYSPTKVEP
jgi:hypothetical protein